MEFINCIIYLIFSGIIIFIIGRIYPRRWIKPNSFLMKSFPFEKQGKIYEKLHIKKWKTKLPDASLILGKLFPWLMPTKRLNNNKPTKIALLLKETCVAESTHFFAILTGFACIRIWRRYGFIISILNSLWHIPFILIQRYNRPRLLHVLSHT